VGETATPKKCKNSMYHTVCGQCGRCHQCTLAKPQPRTQKAKGILFLGAQGYSLGVQVAQIKWLIQSDEDVDCAAAMLPAFCRPCPETPQHGYIDSRVVKTKEDLKALWKQVHEDDPKGEIMMMEFIKPSLNMIWTPSLLAIGKGHDGATAGKDTISIPLVPPKKVSDVFGDLTKAGVKEGDWPYIEVVTKAGQEIEPILTQLRAGPPLESCVGDFIPKKVTVAKVIKADPKYKDLEWRDLINAVADEKGVVVWHPGGALTDHFSIHSRNHNIPVLYGPDEPQVGDKLVPPEEVPSPDPESVLRGIVAGATMHLYHKKGNGYGYGGNTGPAISAILAGLHHSPAMVGDAGKWIGVAVALMLRIGTIAMKGEMRHIRGSKTGAKLSREAVYEKGYDLPLGRLRASINRLVNGFRYGDFGGGGVGGPKWAACGKAMIPLFEGVRVLAASPTPENVRALIRALNVVVNQAHNGGWWLNKFSNESVFASLQKGYPAPMLEAGAVFHQAEEHLRKLKPSEVDKHISGFAKWPETRLVAPKVSSVEMFTREGVAGIQFRIRTNFLRSAPRLVHADPAAFAKLVKAISADLYLVDDEKGNLHIEARGKGMPEPVTIWAEKDLDEIVEQSMQQVGHAVALEEPLPEMDDDLDLDDDE
jgi:hypothetical protein